MLNMVNNVAQNFFGFGGSSTNDNNNNMGGFSNMGFMGAGSNMFSPFGYSQNNYYMPSNGNYYYYDDGSEQREYEERKRQAEQIQRQHEEEMRKKYDEALIKQKTQQAQSKWKSFSERYSKDQGIFLLQTIGAVVRGLTIIKNERLGIKTNYTYEEKQKILDTLQNNKNIIYMLIKARKEAERRRQEEAMLKINERELEKMRKEEENRKNEEKLRIEEEKKMRELDQEGKLTGDVIDGILSEKKKEDRGVIISTAELEKYFGKEVLPGQMKEQIIALLDEWKEKQPPELAKPEKKADLEK